MTLWECIRDSFIVLAVLVAFMSITMLIVVFAVNQPMWVAGIILFIYTGLLGGIAYYVLYGEKK